jgi:hypothetical protein
MMIMDYLIITITIFNLVILLLISNLLIRLADAIRNLNKDVDDYFYLTKIKPVKSQNNQEKGLVDI